MPRPRLLLHSSRTASRASRSPVCRPIFRAACASPPSFAPRLTALPRRTVSTSAVRLQDAAPSASGPTATPIEMTDGEYHELADEYLENILVRFEELQDQTDAVDIEYSSGVMTIRVADKGTYVINKQPPNKQLWLSSPLSGPKRYDWCSLGDGKSWAYLRDNSTLDQLILEELDMDLGSPSDE